MNKMSESYVKLAHAVIRHILRETGKDMPIFERQYACSEVAETRMYECGFDMILRITDGCPVASEKGTKTFGTVTAQLKGLSRGMGFILWVKDGLIHSLEGYTYEEKLPHTAEAYTLSGGDVGAERENKCHNFCHATRTDIDLCVERNEQGLSD